MCDYVDPTPKGTSWGLGGTCVNVGCIPKKLMHRAGLIHEAILDAKSFGFACPDDVQHSWETLVDNVQNYIGSLNFGYRFVQSLPASLPPCYPDPKLDVFSPHTMVFHVLFSCSLAM